MTGAATGARLVLTFDDRGVAGWLAAADLLARYEARVTFCVHAIHEATAEELAGLRALQSQGHEIACHSKTHAAIKPFVERHGWPAYFAQEVDAALADHRAAGFAGQSWAAPFHAAPPKLRAGLATRVRVMRARGPIPAGAEDRIEDRLYHAPAPFAVDVLGSLDTRHPKFAGWDWTETLLDRLADHGGIAVFSGHEIAVQRRPGFWMHPDDLARFLDMARARGIGFTTLKQIVQPG